MLRLQELVTKESRLQRLQQATRKEEVKQVVAITKELANFQARLRSESKTRGVLFPSGSEAFARPKSLKWPHPPCPKRTVFLSITELERTYQLVPRDVLEPSLFIFDTERKWCVAFLSIVIRRALALAELVHVTCSGCSAHTTSFRRGASITSTCASRRTSLRC